MRKITNKEMFTVIANVLAGAEIQPITVGENTVDKSTISDFIAHQIDLLDKKSASRKPSKVQTENEAIKGRIYDTLANSESPMTISELIASDTVYMVEDDARKAISSQKCSAIVKLMIEDRILIRTEAEKRRVEFSIAE